jgi:hypothetical protein
MVPEAGFEPARPFGQMLLRHPCMPFHHSGILYRNTGKPATIAVAALAGEVRPDINVPGHDTLDG